MATPTPPALTPVQTYGVAAGVGAAFGLFAGNPISGAIAGLITNALSERAQEPQTAQFIDRCFTEIGLTDVQHQRYAKVALTILASAVLTLATGLITGSLGIGMSVAACALSASFPAFVENQTGTNLHALLASAPRS
ncbi:MAG: hypothetical protein SP1CHLAM54_05490 [Chlamydiia bacterium]|nr:hypothetical protein [Chlamydiia bacterium]MCH9615459.1 hypothetical protein [Chlamydiia bacterium]MCH9629114.1 hypothetical protein [Chlamydiia bacterium]